MSGLKSGPAVPAWLAAGLIGVAIGGAGGFYGSAWAKKPVSSDSAPGAMGAMGGGGMMGGGGGGGAQDHPNAAALIRTVGSLATLEKLRGKELTAEQRSKVAEAAAALKTEGALTEAECEQKLAALTSALSEEQREALEALSPRRGRGGRGGGPGGGMMAGRGGGNAPAGGNPGSVNGPGGGGMMSASMGGGGGMGGGGMGGGPPRIDYEHPFKEGRGRERLEELLGLLGK